MYLYVHGMYVQVLQDQKKASDPLDVGLQEVPIPQCRRWESMPCHWENT